MPEKKTPPGRVIGLVIYALLTIWAGAMLWWFVVEMATDPAQWMKPTSWFASSVICWAYWYWRVIR